MSAPDFRALGLSSDQEDILLAVREFVEGEIIPRASEYEAADRFPDEIVQGLRELGIFGFTIPEQYGGMGLDLTTYCLAIEEISRGWMSVSGIINTHFICSSMLLQSGTDEQRERLLPQMAAGEVRGAFSMTEPHCGSDVQAIDGPFAAIRDLDGMREVARRSRLLGMDGKWALHPDQITIANEVYSPEQKQFDLAVAILEAYRIATEDEGRGAVMFNGEMIDEASRKMALQVEAAGRAAGMTPTPAEA